jgi:hypothetical protein
LRGCPAPAAGTPAFPSFESWRNVVGGILHTAGISGFLDNLRDAQREADEESEDIRGFFCGWEAKVGLGAVFATDLVPIGQDFFPLQKDVKTAAIQEITWRSIRIKFTTDAEFGDCRHPKEKPSGSCKLSLVPHLNLFTPYTLPSS